MSEIEGSISYLNAQQEEVKRRKLECEPPLHLLDICPSGVLTHPLPLLFIASTEIAIAREDIARRRNQLVLGSTFLEEERARARELKALIELEGCVVRSQPPLARYFC